MTKVASWTVQLALVFPLKLKPGGDLEDTVENTHQVGPTLTMEKERGPGLLMGTVDVTGLSGSESGVNLG